MVIVFIFCAFLYVLIEQGIMSWLPTFNNRILNLPSSLSVEMASILALSTAIGRFGAGVILKKVKWYPVLTVCLLAGMILILLALPLANRASSTENMTWLTAPIAAYVFPLIGLFLAPIYPAINSVILSALPLKQHGPMSGLIVIFSALGGTTGSIITGNLFEYMGGQKAFYFTLIPIAILMVLLFVFNRRVST
jgi:fucose permease